MNFHALYHKAKSNYCYCYDSKKVHIRFRAAKQDLDQVILIFGDKYSWDERKSLVMEHTCSDELYDYFTAEVEPEFRRLAYIFELFKDKERLYFTEWGTVVNIHDEEIYKHFFQYPYMHETEIHKVPQWVRDAVFYQIFPERFNIGNHEKNSKELCLWSSKPTPTSFYGGDLKGIIDKIGYLEELGISALYLTPIFESPSNHKYDTTDYYKIDPNFGDLDTLKELVSKCHAKGIKVVLDAVFNHSGYEFKPFLDAVEKGPDSPYYDWFHINKWPIENGKHSYDCFAFAQKMPKLNTQNAEVREYLTSVAKYWIEEADIDGWRLDVSDEVDHEFWRSLRNAVKAVKPEAYIVGENWLNSLPWLMGDQFDAVMNYPFTRNCIQYFANNKITDIQFKNYINTIQMNNTQQVNEVMLNLLDSHDTPRFLTLSGCSKSSLKLAAAFQLAYLGTPCIYYGTEIGMEGGGDPDCRKGMEWNEDKWDTDLLAYYKKLIEIRKKSEALRRGSFRWLDAAKGLIAFERITDKEKAVVVINKLDRPASIILNAAYNKVVDVLTNQEYAAMAKGQAISIDKNSAKILILQ